MTWFVIIMIVVVALVVGPIMMLRPDAAQKQKERLRARAAAKGLRFTVKNLPQQEADAEKPAPISVYFFPPTDDTLTSDWLLLRASYEHDIHFLKSWVWQGNIQASAREQHVLRQYLPRLHESVMAVSSGSKGICVYWYERGGDEALDQIMALLTELKNIVEQKDAQSS